jgi:uncharacterized membrane protein YkoI
VEELVKRSMLCSCLAITLVAASSAAAQATYKRDIPDSLAKQAKITETAAADVAQHRFPKAKIESVELERENGKLLYSYDLRTEGKSGIDEVQVNAMTGKIVSVQHETPAMERKEAAEEKKAAAKKKPER